MRQVDVAFQFRDRGRRGKWFWGAVVTCALTAIAVSWVLLHDRLASATASRSDAPGLKPVGDGGALRIANHAIPGAVEAPAGMVFIPGGTCLMGSELSGDDARPAHEVRLAGFWLDVHEVTVREFAAFVAATGFQTSAERTGKAWGFSPKQKRWVLRDGATWQKPDGRVPLDLESNLPATQVSWSDAAAYARWAGKRLPTEAEWEYAARGGLSDADFPWGRKLRPQGRYEANYWQGWFPDEDLAADGFAGPAPAKSFRANNHGLYDMAGNVWEWCADWYAADYYRYTPRDNPTGPLRGDTRVVRGGSWLCAENSSRGLTVHGRDHRPPESAYQHIGFRCARSAGTE